MKRLLFLFALTVSSLQCTKSSARYLKDKLVADEIVDRSDQITILDDSQKKRENDYVIKVVINNVRDGERIKRKFKRIEPHAKNDLDLVRHVFGKWLPHGSEWEKSVYTWINNKNGTLYFVVFLSSEELVIYVSQR